MAEDWEEDTNAASVDELVESSKPGLKRACVTLLTGTQSGEVYRLNKGISIIGRAQNAEVRITDDGISRQHAELRLEGDGLWAADLKSLNGTFVNGERITAPTLLHDGDKIQVGDGRRGPVTAAIQQAFFDCVNGVTPDRHGWLTLVNSATTHSSLARAVAR